MCVCGSFGLCVAGGFGIVFPQVVTVVATAPAVAALRWSVATAGGVDGWSPELLP
ncbi:hypothetical protein Dimus_015845, partial [Dionaea muscipula]